jgi:DNA replication protein DnaC
MGNAPEFDAFWTLYPRKVAKLAALRAWNKRVAPLEVPDVMAGLNQYIPHATTWLNGRRWEDDLGASRTPRPQEPEKRSNGLLDKMAEWRKAWEAEQEVGA